MLILTDNDVVGAVRVFRRILASPEWVELTAILELEFIELKDVELPADARDIAVWQRSQEVGALLITGNRSSGEGSLDQTIAEQTSPKSLPVLTIGDPRRVIRDPVYARECALSLLDFVDRIETLRGTGRLFIPSRRVAGRDYSRQAPSELLVKVWLFGIFRGIEIMYYQLVMSTYSRPKIPKSEFSYAPYF